MSTRVAIMETSFICKILFHYKTSLSIRPGSKYVASIPTCSAFKTGVLFPQFIRYNKSPLGDSYS